MNWIFRCNIANERHGDQTIQGIGHAMRCISLAKVVESKGDSALLLIEGDEDVEPFLDEYGIKYIRNKNHVAAAREAGADIFLTDINYLERDSIREYRTVAPVVNLAPRGVPKYYADLTFTSEKIRDIPEPEDASSYEWYAGPEFTIINKDFVRERERLKSGYGDDPGDFPVEKRVVIHMGGVDKYDRTSQIVNCLNRNLAEEYEFTVGVGPFNPNIDELRERCEESKITLNYAPDNLAEMVSGARLAILGTGISAYESLAIGVPSANLGVSEFHNMRGRFLEEQLLGVYLGNMYDVDSDGLNSKITALLMNDDKLRRMSRNGFSRVDGRAASRIVEKIQSTV